MFNFSLEYLNEFQDTVYRSILSFIFRLKLIMTDLITIA